MESEQDMENRLQLGTMQTLARQLGLMKFSFDREIRLGKYDRLKKPINDPNPAKCTIGLNGIAQKFDSYANLDDFLADINQLARSYLARFPGDRKLEKAANGLQEISQSDAKGIEACAECVENWRNNRDDYFTMACSTPHLLVFAKLDEFPYWPAKAMSLVGGTVYVEFFGDHSHADVPPSNCQLYTKYKKAKNSQLNVALKELEEHIEKIVLRFGSINPAGSKARLDPDNMKQQLMEMIPGAFQTSENNDPIRRLSLADVSGSIGATQALTQQNHAITLDMPSHRGASIESNQVKMGQKRRIIDSEASDSREEVLEKRMVTDSITIGAEEGMSSSGLSLLRQPQKARKSFPSPKAQPNTMEAIQSSIQLEIGRITQMIDQVLKKKSQLEEDKRRMQAEIKGLKNHLAEAVDQNKKDKKEIFRLKEQIGIVTSGSESVACENDLEQ